MLWSHWHVLGDCHQVIATPRIDRYFFPQICQTRDLADALIAVQIQNNRGRLIQIARLCI